MANNLRFDENHLFLFLLLCIKLLVILELDEEVTVCFLSFLEAFQILHEVLSLLTKLS